MEDLYINDFHRQNSEAAQREVLRMMLHPYTREQKLQQIMEIHNQSQIDKQSSIMERSKNQI